MSTPAAIRFVPVDLDALAAAEGRIAVLVPAGGRLDPGARRINRLSRGALERLVASQAFADLAEAGAMELSFPAGLNAVAVQVVKLPRRAGPQASRKAGAAIGAAAAGKDVLVVAGSHPRAAEIAFGLALRAYSYTELKGERKPDIGAVEVMVGKPEEVAAAASDDAARAEGVFFARDLVNTPANILTTDDFAARLAAMQELGLEVEILEEADLAELGMRLLLGVGQGSASPSKVVVMRWQGGAAEAPPVAIAGKGVVFDTGGISIKPAQGMEEMTADMGGAGVVSGLMRTLALRRAKVNVVGIVGLVENMPGSNAIRPGDVIRSMKGDTVEVINTDAEGRLVLADVLWYVQDRFSPSTVIDLATLTGAVIIALGHERAGVFANDEGLAAAFLRAAATEGEGAWHLPLGAGYDKALKSGYADMKNVGGRPAGSITAAQFLQRFVKPGTPWMHLDIAGVCRTPEATSFAPKGASGWGVLSLDRWLAETQEG